MACRLRRASISISLTTFDILTLLTRVYGFERTLLSVSPLTRLGVRVKCGARIAHLYSFLLVMAVPSGSI